MKRDKMRERVFTVFPHKQQGRKRIGKTYVEKSEK